MPRTWDPERESWLEYLAACQDYRGHHRTATQIEMIPTYLLMLYRGRHRADHSQTLAAMIRQNAAEGTQAW